MKLAIIGHETRGKEVIEILEMLGGKNHHRYNCRLINEVYNINKYGNIDWYVPGSDSSSIIFTLEEFLEKFPYKVGDKVSSKYLKNYKIVKMEWEDCNNRVIYKLQGMGWYSAEELQPYKEQEIMKEGVYVYNEINCYHQDFADKVQIKLGDDYEIKVEEGKTYIVKKKSKYPKTYVECAKLLGCFGAIYIDGYNGELLDKFQELLICRDAYWKIAGEQMGLGKPWEPDWLNSNTQKYCIYYVGNELRKQPVLEVHHFLAFPTIEMQDFFYENFKELIKNCKDLL